MNHAIIPLSSPIRQALYYQKFIHTSLNILILDSEYHLQKECLHALKNMGHKAHSICVGSMHQHAHTEYLNTDDILKNILQALVTHRPDFVLSINHIGFDSNNVIGSILRDLNIPLAVWYVDSPCFILADSSVPSVDISTMFVWERAYIPYLQKIGYEHIFYLPLACDTSIMQPSSLTSTHYHASFVGNSTISSQKKWQKKLSHQDDKYSKKIMHDLLQDRSNLSKYIETNALAVATWRGTYACRQRVLKQIPPHLLHLFGDAGWHTMLPHAHYGGVVQYGPKLARIYGQSMFNLNITSLQMPSAVNQRVFDVPAAGGFLLSDAQSDMAEHFVIGKEAVVYDSPEEIPELMRYYEKHTHLREKIIQAAYATIQARHTYMHRMESMIKTMQRRYRVSSSFPQHYA